MEPIPEAPGLAPYLAADDVIDHGHPEVAATAARLRHQAATPEDYARAAYVYVRDEVPHSFDSGDDRVAWRASDVLATRNGICYAKAHALVALLRHEGIPAGLCYQRLTEDDGSDPVVHGLIALRLSGTGRWSRQDPRGNKPGVDARFSLGEERLAFPVRPVLGELDYPALYAAPPAPVLAALRGAADRADLASRIPDRI
ncbi:transglutaminase-like domain-containing protein [Actinacidiphila yeochonensis]|uniref:transglutaminase-like domain-containing protein n=1 Tax=Actinacidiphila yeochonensis TaxID=89050 RepID=UPI00055F7223|nr:transglutaminase family protein [Actinacidiphila yeochonensis]